MNKLSKAQRDQLLGIAIGAVALMAALWYFGVTAKQAELADTQKKSGEMRKKLHDAESTIRQEDEINSTLTNRTDVLAKREATLAPDRDTYAWLVITVNAFLQSHKDFTVNIDNYTQPEINETGVIPKFPYKWATFHLKGTGYYQDFGKFFAAFENAFPYFRIQNPLITANSGPAMEAEKLSVSFDVVAPVTSSGSDTK